MDGNKIILFNHVDEKRFFLLATLVALDFTPVSK